MSCTECNTNRMVSAAFKSSFKSENLISALNGKILEIFLSLGKPRLKVLALSAARGSGVLTKPPTVRV